MFDVPIPSSTQLTPTIAVPTVIPTVSISAQPSQTQTTPIPSNIKQYSAFVIYEPEGRSESINVSLTLNNTIVTEVTAIHSMNDGKSRRYQMDFEAAIQSLVVGKDIKTLNLSRVAGASFTTDAFMQAVKKIQSKI
ncbi:MAG: hypothetical protein NTZ55_04690 [Candidatus Roizmanbacteria bacterium]|nr:hypothetical protein [Candidatus Roizmanbacteria bacterium]